MKQLHLLVWITQLGLSTALPLAGFIVLAAWLHKSCGWGTWVIWVGIVLGLYVAVTGFLNALKTLKRLTDDSEKGPPPVAFNEHD
ncbi:MAG: AtpZ/AtpI family protein [Oscillospiraceae bacterium]|nr:AtpZ/AtpI family protein [Oscillospiraceae bacterium]